MALALSLRNERNPAALMKKNYHETCDCLVEFINLNRVFHCLRCHESFKTEKLWELHFHPKTGGCRFPGNIERFYENKYYPDYSVWHQRKEEEVKDNRRR